LDFVDQVAFHIGSFAVHWYGVMVALGFAAGLWTAARRGPIAGMTAEQVFDVGPWLIIGALIGARILYVVSYWDQQFAGRPFTEVFMVHHGGLVYYGGLIGASLACILFSVLKKVPLWRIADVLSPSIALGYVFGRIGCLLNGCCYGTACTLPWAVKYPADHPTFPTPVHPTQIYDSLLNLVFYLGLEWLYRRRKFDGQIFATYLIGYAILRSTVEIFRGDYPKHYLGGWATPAHLVSLGIVAAGVILYLVLKRSGRAAAA
jgi:phosphatidylglycerol:prolipoprotein diacylglycerol transferase